MTIKLITTNGGLDGIRSQWKSLEQKDPYCSYYSTYSYLESWWSVYHLAMELDLFILCAYQGERLVGVAPLCIEHKKKGPLSFKQLQFMGRGDYFGFIIDPEENAGTVIKSIMKSIEENVGHFDRIHFRYISQYQALAHFFFKHPQYNKNFLPLVEIPEVRLKRYKSFEEFEKSFPQKTRKYRNKLQNEIGYTFHVKNNIDEVLYKKLTVLHTRQQLYLRKYKGRIDRRLMFEDIKRNEFYEKAICNNKNAYVFYLQNAEGEILSYNMAFLHKNRLLSWNSAYDPEFEEYRLAKIRYYEIFCYLMNEPMAAIFDFGAGRYPWKFEWTHEFTMVYELNVWTKSHKLPNLLYRFQRARNELKK